LFDVVFPAIVVLELLPRVDEPLSDEFADGAPIAVAPVDGVVLPTLPAVDGPASALDVLLPGVVVPRLFVPATLPVVGAAAVVPAVPAVAAEPGVLLPSVLEPSACWPVVLPQGAPSGAVELLVCASATPAPIAPVANTSAPNRCANDFIADLLER
jgi:hypothetical protein